jgi:hypothetical protein
MLEVAVKNVDFQSDIRAAARFLNRSGPVEDNA